MRRIIVTNKEFRNVEQALEMAHTDTLTGLHNRRWLYSFYNDLDKDIHLHVMFIDIDNFKRVNDIYGHSMGDEVIKFVGNLIREHIKDGYITRIGGDEFVVLLRSRYTSDEVIRIAESMLRSMTETDFRKDIMSLLSLSIGIILDQQVNISLDDVLYKCDSAMYHAKSDGKNRYVVYTSMEKSVEISKNIEAEMESALYNNEFHIYLQPKMNMVTSNLYGAETLSRWIHPIDGVRPPDKYISLFEKNGFIVKLDMYMFEQLCKLKASWHEKGYSFASIPISINMSRLHLYRKNFTDMLMDIVNKYNIQPCEIEIEITESVFLHDSIELIQVVDRLHQCGFSVSIDDFGSGYSALNMLKDIPVNIIKIDKEFLKSSSDNIRGKKVIKNIIVMCRDLKMEIVVEGVENTEQIDFLTSCGCEIAQGFYYSKPVNVPDFEEYALTHYNSIKDTIKFSFNNNFISDDGKYEGIFTGDNYRFEKGISPSIHSLYFGGGENLTNYLTLPTKVLYSDSSSISFWIKPTSLNLWTSIIYAEYENSFFQFCPLAWEGHCCYRIRDIRQIGAWYDTSSATLLKDTWYHIVLTYNSITEKACLYINGVAIGTTENIPSPYFLKQLLIGGDVYQRSFEGNLCELIFYNSVISPSEVDALYHAYTSMEDFDAFK